MMNHPDRLFNQRSPIESSDRESGRGEIVQCSGHGEANKGRTVAPKLTQKSRDFLRPVNTTREDASNAMVNPRSRVGQKALQEILIEDVRFPEHLIGEDCANGGTHLWFWVLCEHSERPLILRSLKAADHAYRPFTVTSITGQQCEKAPLDIRFILDSQCCRQLGRRSESIRRHSSEER
jgi:hypothetical protein